MTKENKDYGKSVKAKLLNLSKAEGLPYQPLLIRYASPLELFFRNFKNQYDNPPHGTNSFNNMEPIVSTAWNQSFCTID